jgi:plasmid stabilization system protein ParE
VTRPLLLEPEAIRELDEAVTWYEEQRSGLGQRFLDAVGVTLEQVVAFPAAGVPVPQVPHELKGQPQVGGLAELATVDSAGKGVGLPVAPPQPLVCAA